jgi:uncharacterized protein (UPF0335 family)
MSNTPSSEILKSLVDRLEAVQKEIDVYNEDKRDIYGEAKMLGYDPKIVRMVIKRRKMDAYDRREQDELLNMYEEAVNGTKGFLD